MNVRLPSVQRPMIVWTGAGALILGILLLHLLPHLQVLSIAADDFLLGLEAGQRVLDGHLPSRDWPSPIGPLFALLNALPLVLGAPGDWAHRWADVLMLAVLLPALVLAGRGLPAWTVAAAAVLAAAILCTQQDLLTEDALFFAVTYNRWVNAFLFVPILWLAAEIRRSDISLSADAAVGVALAILAFVKANAALTAGLLILPGLRLRPVRLVRLVVLVAPCLLVAGALMASGILLPYLSDLIDVIHASDSRLFFLLRQASGGLFLASFVSLILLLVQRRRLPRPGLAWLVAWSFFVLFVGNLQNHTAVIPALPLLCLVFGVVLWPSDEAGRRVVLPLAVVGAVGVAMLTAIATLAIRPPAAAAAAAVAVPSPLLPRTAILVSPPPPPNATQRDRFRAWYSADALQRWQDALALVSPGETVQTIGQVNVARIAGARTPRGAFLWQDPNRNWDPAHDADPARRLEGACAVLVRRRPRFDLPKDDVLVGHWRAWLETNALLTRSGAVYDRFDLRGPSCPSASAQAP